MPSDLFIPSAWAEHCSSFPARLAPWSEAMQSGISWVLIRHFASSWVVVLAEASKSGTPNLYPENIPLSFIYLFFFFFNLFIWLRWILVAAQGIFSAVMPRLSSCGEWALQLFPGMWDLSSPTRDWTYVPCILWGGFLTTGPPGKPPKKHVFFSDNDSVSWWWK